MADTSQRKTRFQNTGNNTEAERNRLGASIPQGNEVYANMLNIGRSEDIPYQNTENFSQNESSYFSTAKDVYNEAEITLKGLETKKARLSYTVTFLSNTYTFTAKTSTISEIINGTFSNQEFQDKTVYNSTTALFDGFNTSFVAPATSTGTTSIAIQLYGGSFVTKALKQYNDAGTLISVVAGDIVLGRKYDIVMIGGEAVLFGVRNASQTVAGVIKTSTTALVNAGIDDTTALTPLQLKTKMEAVRKSVVFHNTRDFTETEYDYAGNIILVRKSMAATRIIGTNGSIVFNTAFPTACYNVQISLEFGAATGSQLYWNTPSPTGFNFGWSAFNTVGNGNSCIINIIATGK
jgi:hypothetical protein